MLKSKTMFGLIALVMVLALAQSGYAQLSIGATGNPSPRETATSHTAETNDPTVGNGMIITGSLLSDAYVTGGRLRITYPARVTNTASFPGTDPIAITGTGIFTGATIGAVSNTNGRVDINLPCGTPTTLGGTTGTIILTGVRIDANAIATAPASAFSTTNISSTGSGGRGVGCAPGVDVNATNVAISTPSVEVITSLPAGIGSVGNGGMPSGTATSGITIGGAGSAGTGTGTPATGCNGADQAHEDCGVATVYTNRNTPDVRSTFSVVEGHRAAWFNASTTQFAGAQGFVSDSGFRLTFNGLPAGVTLTLAVAGSTSGQAPLSRTTITTANNTSNVSWGSDLSLDSTADRVTFSITGINVSSSASLSPGSVTVTASMFPVGEALDENDAVIQTSFPRYAAAEIGTATVVSIVPANTTLLIPFALSSGFYDTGIALANTSADPFGTVGGATPQGGTVRLDLYPSNATGAGTAVNFTTSATKKAGTGIAADGTVPAGATWTVNLSELLPLAGISAPFTGYIFIQANFLYAHGAAYVYDGRGFTSGTPVLVLPPPSINGRVGIANQPTAETLAY